MSRTSGRVSKPTNLARLNGENDTSLGESQRRAHFKSLVVNLGLHKVDGYAHVNALRSAKPDAFAGNPSYYLLEELTINIDDAVNPRLRSRVETFIATIDSEDSGPQHALCAPLVTRSFDIIVLSTSLTRTEKTTRASFVFRLAAVVCEKINREVDDPNDPDVTSSADTSSDEEPSSRVGNEELADILAPKVNAASFKRSLVDGTRGKEQKRSKISAKVRQASLFDSNFSKIPTNPALPSLPLRPVCEIDDSLPVPPPNFSSSSDSEPGAANSPTLSKETITRTPAQPPETVFRFLGQVWKCFFAESPTPVDHKPVEDGATYWKCQHCHVGERISPGSRCSTNSLRGHVTSSHPALKPVIDQLLAHREAKTPIPSQLLARARNLTPTGEQRLPGLFHSQEGSQYSEPNFRLALAEFFIAHDLPFSLSESPLLRKILVIAANSRGATLPQLNRHQTREEIMREAHNVRLRIKMEFQEHTGKIHFTIDAWTSPNQLSFFAIVAHRLDEKMVLHQDLVDFIELPVSHTAEAIAEMLWNVWEDFGVLDKVGTVQSDNASNLTAAIKLLSDRYARIGVDWSSDQNRLRCPAHVVNLAAAKLLSVIGIGRFFEPEEANIQGKGKTVERTREKVEEEKLEGGLLDYVQGAVEVLGMVVEEEEEKEEDLDKLGEEKEDPLESVAQPSFTDILPKVRSIVRWIRSSPLRRQIFRNDQTSTGDAISEDKTVNLILDSDIRWSSTYHMLLRFVRLRRSIERRFEHDAWLQLFKLREFEWKLIDQLLLWLRVFAQATVLLSTSRKITISSVQLIYEKLDAQIVGFLRELPNEAAPEITEGLVKAQNCLATYNELKDRSFFSIWAAVLDPRVKAKYFHAPRYVDDEDVKCALVELPRYLDSHYSTILPSSFPTEPDSTSTVLGDFDSLFSTASSSSQSYIRTAAEEFADYCAEPVAHSHVDVGAWWLVASVRLPTLASMARDVLSIPASAVCVERIFSQARDTIKIRRQRLKGDTIRNLMVGKYAVLSKLPGPK